MRWILCIGFMLAVLSGCGDNTTGPGENLLIDLTVYVAEQDGTPIQRALVTTIPPTHEITTDTLGRGTFVDIVSKPYFFIITPPGRATYQYYLALEDADPDSLPLVVVPEPPRVDILFPMNGTIISAEKAVFTGAAIDHEDGVLPDSVLVWRLDDAGEIGRGREIEINGLPLGTHGVTLTAYDSDGKSGSETIIVTVEEYSFFSYFPLVNGAEWLYTHQPIEFNMYNHQQILERWSLDNVTVEMDEADRRISTMTYRATALSNVRHYRYQVVDDLRKSGNSVAITRTTEEMLLWRQTMAGQPDEYLLIETGYDPAYPVLNDVMEPGVGGAYTYSGTATVTWTYIGMDHGTTSFVETTVVTATISAGEPETAVVGGKNIGTVPVTITDGDAQRKWWLAPGFGIVRFQYNTFNANPVATLIGTNLATDAAAPLFTKTAVAPPPEFVPPGDIPETEPDHLKAVRNIMRSVMP